MCKPLPFYLIGSLALTVGSLSAQTNSYITLGQDRVHPTRILARYKNLESLTAQASADKLRAAGVVVKQQLELVPGLVVLEARPTVALQSVQAANPDAQAQTLSRSIAALQNSGLFEYVQPSYVYTSRLTPTDAAFVDGTLWGLRNTGQDGGVLGADIDAVRAWDITTGSTNVIVAVIDSGVRYTHTDLVGQMWHNPTEIAGNGLDDDGDGFIDNIVGINAVNGTGDPMDDVGHGTHVAGTIGAAANGGGSSVGVAWQVRIMACKFLDSNGVGLTDDAVRCIQFATKKGAKVMNNSWGGGPFDRALFDAISEAQKQNILFVVASGNDANNNDVFLDYPSSYQLDNIVSVGALDRFDNPAVFSNYGATNVDVFAPGVDIFSTFNSSDTAYEFLAGTSMAAPHVSGVAALIISKYPKALLPEIRERIISTAVRIPSLVGRAVSQGRVNAYRALTAAADGTMEISVYPPPGNDLLIGSIVPMFVTVTDLLPVTNATVKATIGGTTNVVTFQNNGTPPDLVANDATYSTNITVPVNLLTNDLAINFNITAPGKQPLTNTIIYHIVRRPANDNFETAAKIPASGGLFTATNRFATMQLNEPRHAQVPTVDASLWWNWSPSRSGSVIVDTAGSAINTVLAVYTNNTLRTLREIASVDDLGLPGSRLQGYVQFDAIAGITYRIAVAGFDTNAVGGIRLRVEPGGKPDTNAPVAIITSPVAGIVLTNTEPRLTITGVAADPEPNASGVKEVFVQVNNGLADKAFGTTNWSSTNLLSVGINTIRVTAVDFAGNRSDPDVISVRYDPVNSANDMFFNALELTGARGTVTGSTTNATKEFGEPYHAGNEGGKSLWWFFRAPADGVLSLTTINSDFDTLVAVYTGTRVNNLTLVGSNDDVVDGSGYSVLNQAVRGGQVYHVVVDGYAGSYGTVKLDYTFSTGGVWHVETQAPDGGLVTPGTGFYPANTNLVFTAVPGPGQEFDRWEGSVTSSENPLTIVADSDLQLIARFKAHEPSEGFESGGFGSLPWITAGNAPWTVQSDLSDSGRFAARSGKITHGQTSSLILTNVTLAAGSASFDFKVSSEANWDFLEFFLNGRRLDRWSGEVGWLTFRFDVPAGSNTLEWRYRKDPVSVSLGLDAAFIDNLELPRASSAPAAAPTLNLVRLSDGRVEVTVQGQVNGDYTIQVSRDLVNWEALTRASASSAGKATFIDSASGAGENRFYRVVNNSSAN